MEYIIIPLISKSLSSNIYVIISDDEAVIVDAGLPYFARELINFKKVLENVRKAHMIFTHCHFDHVSGYKVIKRYFNTVETYAHELDSKDIENATEKTYSKFFGESDGVPIDHELSDMEKIVIGSIRLLVIHTPGHTEGSITLFLNKSAFAGDLIFYGGFGRYDLISGDIDSLKKSIERVKSLRPDIIFPGHGEIVKNPEENFEIISKKMSKLS